jgi:hypothetical protein
MAQPVVLLAPTLNAVRQAAAQRFAAREETLVLGNAPGMARGWREALRNADSRNADSPAPSFLPRFASLQEWFVEAATLSAAPLWSTPADRRFVLRSLLPALRPRLKILHRLCRSNDLVRQIDLLIADLRRAGFETFPFGGDWGQDLQLIVSEYNQRLREHSAVDIECAPVIRAQSRGAAYAGKIECVVFDQILAPSPTQWSAMAALGAQAGSTLATLVLPWLRGETQSWDEAQAQATNTALERILSLWREAGAQLEVIAPESENTEKQNAVRGLLSYRPVQAPPRLDLTAAHTPRDEMERIASRVRAQCAAPQDLEKCALVLPDAATYAGILAPAFDSHGVPLRVRRARPHASYPLVARLLRLLQLHESDWELDEIADLFGDGLLRLCSDDIGGATLDIQRLRAACFESRLDSLRDEEECFQRLLRKREESETLDPALARDLACIARLREAVSRIHHARSAGEWHTEIFALWEITLGHLPRRAGSTPAVDTALRQSEAFMEAVESVASRFVRWQPRLLQRRESDANPFSDSAFDCLRLELESATAPLVEKTGAALEVISPLQLLNDVPREVYFAGLTESAWPAFGAPGTLLSRHRSELAALRAHEIEPTQLARYQLALAIVEAEAVHLLHPTRSGGREVLRSPILEDVELCWRNLPSLERPMLPTSRAALLQALGAWAQAGGWQLLSSQLSPSLRAALETTGVDNADLDLQIRIQRERNGAQTLGIYDGALGEGGARLLREIEVLAERENEPLRLDATRLNTYAQCPLKFFYRHILKLDVPCEWQDELNGMQGGTLVHQILERFWKRCALPLTKENQGELWFLLRGIAIERIAAEPIRPFMREIEARRLIGSQPREPGGMLGKVLLAEIAQTGGEGKKPAFAAPLLPLSQAQIPLPPEFGNGIELTLRMALGGFRIEGRLDRLSVSRDGELLAITDYKTQWPGGLPRFSHANWGFDFQLPIYLLIARTQLRQWRETTAGSTPGLHLAAAFFALRDGAWMNGFGESGTLGRNQTQKGAGKISHPKGKELDAENFDAWLDQFEKRVVAIGELAQRGQFNISIQDREISGCNFCEFQTICRRDEAVTAARLNAAYDRRQRFGQEIYLPLPIDEEGASEQ